MSPFTYANMSWRELHALRNRLMRNKVVRLLQDKPVDDLDARLAYVGTHIKYFNQPPYMKRKSKP